MYMCGGLRWTLSVFPGCTSFYVLRQDLSLSPVLPNSSLSSGARGSLSMFPEYWAGFYEDSGVQTPVLTLSWQALYPQSHFPSSKSPVVLERT